MKQFITFLLFVISINSFGQDYFKYLDRIEKVGENDYQYEQCSSDDGKYWAAVTSSGIKIIDITNFKLIKYIPLDLTEVGTASFFHNSDSILVSGNTKKGAVAMIINWRKSIVLKQINPFGYGEFAFNAPSTASRNFLICVDKENQIIILNKRNLLSVNKILLKENGKKIYNLIISSDEKLIAINQWKIGRSNLIVYDISGDIKYSYQYKDFITGLSFTELNDIYVLVGWIKSYYTIFKVEPNFIDQKIVFDKTHFPSDSRLLSLNYLDKNILFYGGGSFNFEIETRGSRLTCEYLNDNKKESYTGLTLNYIGESQKRYNTKYSISKLVNDIVIYPVAYENFNYVIDIKNKKLLGYIYHIGKNIAFVSSDGRFTGDKEAIANLRYNYPKISDKPLISQIDQFYTPKLFNQFLQNTGELNSLADLSKVISLSPEIRIVKPDSILKSSSNRVKISFVTKDKGDGIKQVNYFINGKLVNEDTRGFKQASGTTESGEFILAPGTNVIQAVAVSNNGYQSSPDQIVVDYKGANAESNLFLLTIGLNEYKNPKYKLSYSVADANAFTDQVKSNALGIFKNIYPTVILNKDATKINILNVLNDIIPKVAETDVFVIYYAGHGVMSEGSATNPKDFFLVLHDITQLYGNDELLAQKGISAAELRELCKKIKAQKQLVLLDACQSGGATETFAMRGVAEEKAITQLAQSTGAFLISSTSSEQYASEFSQLGHGVFTYALLEGLKGKADGGDLDKKITIKELESYLNDIIPELTEKFRGTAQFPQSWSKGMDFPIVTYK